MFSLPGFCFSAREQGSSVKMLSVPSLEASEYFLIDCADFTSLHMQLCFCKQEFSSDVQNSFQGSACDTNSPSTMKDFLQESLPIPILDTRFQQTQL